MEFPSFFKVLVRDFKSILRIPLLFVKNFEEILPHDALLKTKSGESWSVKIELVDDRYCFTHGWPKFVKDHQLEMGDFLVFWLMLEEKSFFRIAIYGITGCEKEFNLAKSKTSPGPAICKPENFEIDPETPCMQPTTNPSNTTKCAKSGRPNRTDKVKNENPNYGSNTSDDYGFVERKNPRFEKLLRYKSHKNRMNIPMKFAKESRIKYKDSVVLKNSEGRTWDVELSLREEDSLLYMLNGWSEFRKANKLYDGGTYAFEFIPSSGYVEVQMVKKRNY